MLKLRSIMSATVVLLLFGSAGPLHALPTPRGDWSRRSVTSADDAELERAAVRVAHLTSKNLGLRRAGSAADANDLVEIADGVRMATLVGLRPDWGQAARVEVTTSALYGSAALASATTLVYALGHDLSFTQLVGPPFAAGIVAMAYDQLKRFEVSLPTLPGADRLLGFARMRKIRRTFFTRIAENLAGEPEWQRLHGTNSAGYVAADFNALVESVWGNGAAAQIACAQKLAPADPSARLPR